MRKIVIPLILMAFLAVGCGRNPSHIPDFQSTELVIGKVGNVLVADSHTFVDIEVNNLGYSRTVRVALSGTTQEIKSGDRIEMAYRRLPPNGEVVKITELKNIS